MLVQVDQLSKKYEANGPITILEPKERPGLDTVELERRRIGRDLHDTTSQELTAAGFFAVQMAESLQAEDHPQKELARKISKSIQRALTQLREFTHGLLPMEVPADGLAPALKTMVRETADCYQIPINLCTDDEIVLPAESAATQLFLIAKEAVVNAAKHAQSHQIEVKAKRTEKGFRLQVSDQGVGFSTKQTGKGINGGGLGLQIMRSRARLINGQFEIKNADTGGTVVICTLNLSHDDDSKRKQLTGAGVSC